MPLFDRFKHGVDVTKFKAEQMLRINQVEGEISAIQREISGVQSSLAIKTLALYREGQLTHPELVGICDSIKALEQQIEVKRVQVGSIRAEQPPQYVETAQPGTNCPSCNMPYTTGTGFCTNCGAALPKPVVELTCPNCHRPIVAGAKFCTECGFTLKSE